TTTGTATATTDAPRAATPAATSGSTYTLDDPANKLVAHVGHKVEVTGTLAPSATASASGSTARASAGQRLSVSEVKMISADCAAKYTHANRSSQFTTGTAAAIAQGD